MGGRGSGGGKSGGGAASKAPKNVGEGITDKNELLSFLKHYHIEYRHKIGLNPDMTFGIEIECSTSGKRIF